MDFGIKNRAALISGGTQGIGLAAAQALLNEGANVAIFSRSTKNIESAKQTLKVGDSKLLTIQCDLLNSDSADEMLSTISTELGDIDIFVGSSGGPSFGTAETLSREDLLGALESNFVALATLTNKLIPQMRKSKWGRIVYVTSSTVIQPISQLALSNVSRSALTSFTKTLSNDVAIDGITVNTIMPGKIDTARLEEVTRKKADAAGITFEKQKEKEFLEIPTGRYGRPQEIANMIAFLCSEPASYVTGLKIAVDGGMINSV